MPSSAPVPVPSKTAQRRMDYNAVHRTLKYMQYGSLGLILVSGLMVLDQGTARDARARSDFPSVEINLDVLEPYYRRSDHFKDNKPRTPLPLVPDAPADNTSLLATTPTGTTGTERATTHEASPATATTPPAADMADSTEIITALPTARASATPAAPTENMATENMATEKTATGDTTPKGPPPPTPLPEKAPPPPLPDLPPLPGSDMTGDVPPLPGADDVPSDDFDLPPLPDITTLDNEDFDSEDDFDLPPISDDTPFADEEEVEAITVLPADTATDDASDSAARLIVAYSPGETELPISAEKDLDAIASAMLSDANISLTINAYSSATGDQNVSARRISLDRALSVRTYLMEHGLEIFRFQVNAYNAEQGDRQPDRVTLFY